MVLEITCIGESINSGNNQNMHVYTVDLTVKDKGLFFGSIVKYNQTKFVVFEKHQSGGYSYVCGSHGNRCQ